MHVSRKIISSTILFFVIINILISPSSYALDARTGGIIPQNKKGNVDILATAGGVKKTIAKTSLKKLNKGQKKFVPGQILVKFKKNKLNLAGSSGKARLASFSSVKNVRPVKEFARQNTSLLSVTWSETTEQAIKRLKTDTSVEFVQPNYIYSTQTAPNDTYFSDAWGLDNIGQNVLGTTGTPGADIGAIKAWEIFTGATINTGSLIAVIDDGVAYNHSDLVNKMWDGTNCVDKNNVFLGGCVHGYDFINDRKTPLPIRWDTHGTVVAGIIGAQLNNSIGLSGVNPNVRIMAIKAGEEGGLTSAGIIDGMNFAKYNGAKIINASWGMRGLDDTTPYVNNFDYMLYNAIKDFGDSGGLFITSAGNSAMNHESGNMNDRLFPSDFSLNTTLSGWLMLTGLTNIISVAATDKNDALASFSDYGSGSVHIGAPGKGIYSTIITDATGFAEDFSTASTGSVGVFTATGNTLNNWGVAGQKIWTDLPNEPYMSGADTSIEKAINFGSSITSAKFSYKAWCDTPSSASWKDYVRLEFSTGSAWNLVYMFDKDSLSVSGSASSIGLRTGYYETNSLSLPPTYISSDFKFRFRWITDGIDDQDVNGYNFGCYIDDISMVTYDDGTWNMYDAYDGTSMAAPFVSGIASLAWGYKQNLTAQEVKDIILSTGTPLASLSDKTISGKRASAYRSLASLASPTVTNLKIYTASGGTEITQSGYTSTTAPYVRWDSPIGQGTMSGYLLSVSSGSGVVYSGTTNATYFSGFTLTQDDAYTLSVVWMNDMGATWSVVAKMFMLDTTVPAAPTNIALNGGILIWSGTQGSVVLSGSWAPSESWAIISYSISDGIRSVSGTGTHGNNGSFTINNIDVTSLDDGILNISVSLVDSVGNTSALGLSTVQKSALATGEQAIFLSGASINVFNTQIQLKADKTVSYSITGSELLQSITGSIIGSGSVIENLSFTGLDGQKNITATFTDLAQVSTSITKSIIIDTIAPIISVLSHTNNTFVTGSTVTVTGTLSDMTGISTFSQNMSPVLSFSGNWTMSTTLVGWDNPITFRATDIVGNNSIWNFSLTRIAVSSLSSTIIQSPTEMKVNFTSDLNGTWVVLYGTSSGSLTSIMTGSLTGTSHEVILTNLLPDTEYYYRAHAIVAGYSGSLSNVGTFRTPRVVDVSIGSTASATGTIWFSGTTSTGAVFWMNSGSITLISSDSVNSISFSLSGLTISASGSWNSMIQAPELYNFTGSVSVDTGYTRTGSVYKIGSDSSPLAFSGQIVNTSIYVGLGLNGKILRIYRSDDNGTTFANIGSCTVSGGNCVFSTNHFSLFAFAEPVAVVSTPVAQSSGGGGGWPVKDNCPNGDTSPSYYDKKCSADNVTQAISSATTTVKENNDKASESSFSFNSPLFNTPRLSLKAKKYIDSTFIGVIDKRLEAKTEKQPTLRLKNYEALKKYFYKKQLQAKDSKEKQIFRYIQSEFEKKAAKKN